MCNFIFNRGLLLRFINENKCEKRDGLEGGNGIWQTTSELITTTSSARRSRYIFSVLREAIKSIQTGRRETFSVSLAPCKICWREEKISLAVPSPSHINDRMHKSFAVACSCVARSFVPRISSVQMTSNWRQRFYFTLIQIFFILFLQLLSILQTTQESYIRRGWN